MSSFDETSTQLRDPILSIVGEYSRISPLGTVTTVRPLWGNCIELVTRPSELYLAAAREHLGEGEGAALRELRACMAHCCCRGSLSRTFCWPEKIIIL